MSARSKFGARLATKQSVTNLKLVGGDLKAKKGAGPDDQALSPATCASLLRLWSDIMTGSKGPLPTPFDPNAPCSAPWALNIAEEGGDIQAVMRLSTPSGLFCFRVLEKAALPGAAIRPSDAIFLASVMTACIKALKTRSVIEVEDALVTVALAHQRPSKLSSQTMDTLERALTATLKERFSVEYIKAEDMDRIWAAGIDYMRRIVVPKKLKGPQCLVM